MSNEIKPVCVIQGPIASRSGYGDHCFAFIVKPALRLRRFIQIGIDKLPFVGEYPIGYKCTITPKKIQGKEEKSEKINDQVCLLFPSLEKINDLLTARGSWMQRDISIIPNVNLVRQTFK